MESSIKIDLPLETDINMNKAGFNRTTTQSNTENFPDHYMLVIPHKQDQGDESKQNLGMAKMGQRVKCLYHASRENLSMKL